MNITVSDSIRYIGADDLDIDLFEGQYKVPQGISYNSYLIEDEKLAIMDTVDARRGEEWMARLAEMLAGRRPDYLVVHHLEPDHASMAAAVVEAYPGIKVVLSDKASKMFAAFFPGRDYSASLMPVKDGDTLSLGRHELHFVAAPFVHWPEVMVSYESCDKVLFAADGFGRFGALSATEGMDWAPEARRYYINICGKYGVQVQKLLKAASALDIRCIAPLHGPVLRENLGYYLGLYDTWSSYKPESEGVLVAYASIHGGTKAAAGYLAGLLRERASEVVVMDLCREDMSLAVAEAFRLGRLVLAAASYDTSVFPPMYDFVHHLALKGYQNRRVGIVENGSWAPSAARTLRPMLEGMKNLDIVEPCVTIISRMKEDDKPNFHALAEAMLA